MSFVDGLQSPAKEIAQTMLEGQSLDIKADHIIAFNIANTPLVLMYEVLKMSPEERVRNGWTTGEIEGLYADLNLTKLGLDEPVLLRGIEDLRVILREYGAPHQWLQDKK